MEPNIVYKYSHFRYVHHTDTEEQAKWEVEHLKEITNFLAKEYPVYLRISPEYFRDNPFDSNKIQYLVRARFSIGPKDIGIPAGIRESHPVYGDPELMPFGFGPINFGYGK